jgi:hypothetical protein
MWYCSTHNTRVCIGGWKLLCCPLGVRPKCHKVGRVVPATMIAYHILLKCWWHSRCLNFNVQRLTVLRRNIAAPSPHSFLV